VFQKAEFDADLECIEKLAKSFYKKVSAKEQERCAFSSISTMCKSFSWPSNIFQGSSFVTSSKGTRSASNSAFFDSQPSNFSGMIFCNFFKGFEINIKLCVFLPVSNFRGNILWGNNSTFRKLRTMHMKSLEKKKCIQKICLQSLGPDSSFSPKKSRCFYSNVHLSKNRVDTYAKMSISIFGNKCKFLENR
jgi:hypothetical protein